jgi:hypothetical protein
MYCTDVRTPESGKAPTASSTRCLSLVIPEDPSFRSKMVVRMSWMTACRSSTVSESR